MTENPPDMRDLVESNRGLLKKIELAIPGFRGYRKREDLRIADNLLRLYLADSLAKSSNGVGDLKKTLSKKLELDLVGRVGEIENNIHVLDKRLRHAEQGYSGISPDYRISDSELNAIYNYDHQILVGVDALDRAVSALYTNIPTTSVEELMKEVEAIANMVRDLSTGLDNRRNAIVAAAGV